MLLINIDVDDVEEAIRFYTSALPLRLGRRFGPDFVELLGVEVPIYLLMKPAGSAPFLGAPGARDYHRHWTPVHLDFAVADLEAALRQAEAAGARREGGITAAVWGRMVQLADPFGNGLCLLQLEGRGYDEIVTG
jgi:predicted enzyme related to lactoylglutathione lyase